MPLAPAVDLTSSRATHRKAARVDPGVGGDRVPQIGARPVRPPGVEPVDGDHPVDHVGEDGGPWATAEAHGDDTAVGVTAHRSIETDEPRRRAEGGGSQPEPPRRRGECPCRRSELDRGGGRRRHHVRCCGCSGMPPS